MKKQIRLLGVFLSQSLKSFFIYRATASITVIFGIMFFAIECILGVVLFSVADLVAGYSFYDYLAMISVASLVTYLYQFMFATAHENLAEAILEGELDVVVVRPVHSLYYYSFFRQDFSCLGNIAVTIPVLIWLYSHYSGITILNMLMFVAFIVLAVVCVYIVSQLFVTLVFWFENSTRILGMSEYFYDAATRPMAIYPRSIILFLSYVLPFGIVTNAGWRIPMGGVAVTDFVYLLAWDVIGLIVVKLLWNKGMRHYLSAN